jgi:hypothetical protein
MVITTLSLLVTTVKASDKKIKILPLVPEDSP